MLFYLMKYSYGYGGGAGTLSMDTGDSSNGPPTSNIPATAQAFIAPKKDPPSPQPQTNGTNKPKFGGADICPRCNKGQTSCLHFGFI